MKFLVTNYSSYRPQIPVLSVLCPQLNLLNPLPNKIPGYATGRAIPLRPLRAFMDGSRVNFDLLT